MSSKRTVKNQVTNVNIPQAATILNATSKERSKTKTGVAGNQGLNDSTQCTI